MQAIVQNAYGSPAGLTLEEIDKPPVKDDGVLIRVHAAALQPGDGFIMRGVPYLVRFAAGWPKPKAHVPGFDVAGHVEAVGKKVTRFRPGDEVFAMCGRACAEYACAPERQSLPKPVHLTFEEAAAAPTSAITALQGLRDAGKLQPGQRVLINGASGGVGTFAVQLAKLLGAEVTGVCSTRNVDLIRSIGADHVIDYTREDFTRNGRRWDLILDNAASRSFADYRRALTPRGTLVPNSAHAGMGYIVRAFVRSFLVRQQGRPFVAAARSQDLAFLKDLLETGKLKSVIDRTVPLSETPAAIAYVATGHARGKVVIVV